MRLSADKLLPRWLGNEMQMQGSDLMAITFISCVSINCLIHVGKPHERTWLHLDVADGFVHIHRHLVAAAWSNEPRPRVHAAAALRLRQ